MDLTASGVAGNIGTSSSSSRERASLLALAWPLGLFVLILAFTIADLEFDVANHLPSAHIEEEIGALAVALAGIAGTALQILRATRRSRTLQRDLESVRDDAERWRVETEALRRRFGTAIEHSFDGWALTVAEKDIALGVLKGLSYKEVAAFRGTTERTVRHQAVAIYRKAGVAGRAEMAALFLRDVLDGPRDRPQVQVQPPAERRAKTSTITG